MSEKHERWFALGFCVDIIHRRQQSYCLQCEQWFMQETTITRMQMHRNICPLLLTEQELVRKVREDRGLKHSLTAKFLGLETFDVGTPATRMQDSSTQTEENESRSERMEIIEMAKHSWIEFSLIVAYRIATSGLPYTAGEKVRGFVIIIFVSYSNLK